MAAVAEGGCHIGLEGGQTASVVLYQQKPMGRARALDTVSAHIMRPIIHGEHKPKRADQHRMAGARIVRFELTDERTGEQMGNNLG